jgi:SLT domain-containing protein
LYENNNTVKDFTQDFVHQILEARRLESITPEGMGPGQRTVMSSSTAKGEISKEQKHRESIVSAQKKQTLKTRLLRSENSSSTSVKILTFHLKYKLVLTTMRILMLNLISMVNV